MHNYFYQNLKYMLMFTLPSFRFVPVLSIAKLTEERLVKIIYIFSQPNFYTNHIISPKKGKFFKIKTKWIVTMLMFIHIISYFVVVSNFRKDNSMCRVWFGVGFKKGSGFNIRTCSPSYCQRDRLLNLSISKKYYSHPWNI